MRRIALISDMHVGSQYALWPPGIFDKTGAELKQNPVQLQLYRKWQEAERIIQSAKCDTIINMGDPIEGGNRKENAALLTATSVDKQCAGVAHLLKNIVKGKRYYSIRGSNYHGSVDTDIDDDIISRLAPSNTDCNLGAVSVVEIEGKRIYLTHGGGPGSKIKATNLENYLINLLVQYGRDNVDRCDMYIQGHLHQWRRVDLDGMIGLMLPAWKIFTPDKIHLKNPTQMLSDIGIVILEIGGGIKITPYLFGAPRLELRTREI